MRRRVGVSLWENADKFCFGARAFLSMEKLLPKAPINFASEWKVFYLCDSYVNRFKLQKDYFASD